MEEVETILANLKEREGAHIANYFAAAFFGGFRPTEQVAMCWDDVDFKQRNMRVARAVVRGKAKASTKTYLVRDVELSERAWATFEAQRAITQLVGGRYSGIRQLRRRGPTFKASGKSGPVV